MPIIHGMYQARQESSPDRALTHTSSRYALALVAVCSFGFGVLVRDVAQDYRDAASALKNAEQLAQREATCTAHREQAALYAKALTNLLNGGRVSLPGVVLSCKTKQVKS